MKSPTGVIPRSFRFCSRGLDHLCPLGGLIPQECGERLRRAAERFDPLLVEQIDDPGQLEDAVDLAIKLGDNGFRCA